MDWFIAFLSIPFALLLGFWLVKIDPLHSKDKEPCKRHFYQTFSSKKCSDCGWSVEAHEKGLDKSS